ncbi:MAG: hypothetical protein NPIRA04_09790 [Nitrospirales bacterium]|nr:MAG: hypothetical protein NPIRA04_09790 [Nitrospirales bacterium]
MLHRLVIQLARLGDLLQTLPAIASLRGRYPDEELDLLCAKPLVSIGSFFPGVRHIFPWDGNEWGRIAKSWSPKGGNALSQATDCLNKYQLNAYSLVYNLNDHPRAVIAAHLFANDVIGPGCQGPLSEIVPDWVKYLKIVGAHRGRNRVHLADAFCGVCGVKPPLVVPTFQLREIDWPTSLNSFRDGNGVCVALVLGSGDADRRVPLRMWEEWICTFLTACPDGRVMLVGGGGERELTYTLLDRIPSRYVGQIWDACGQTSLMQLANILSHCSWVLGSDTGPLHLGVACGAKVQGFYFSRARVHETGPYGHGHWVWQAEQTVKHEVLGVWGESEEFRHDATCKGQNVEEGIKPEYWPVSESVELLLTESCSVIPDGWSLWSSQQDDWGAYFIPYTDPNGESTGYREQIWENLQSENINWDSVLELMSLSGSSHVLERSL